MTTKELAKLLDGREIMREITCQEEADAKSAGLVVLFGYSDDCAEFRGTIDDEVGCYGGNDIYITRNGVLQAPECGDENCTYFLACKKTGKLVTAVWHDNGNPCWTYETDIPHETFNVYENRKLFCVGIVFSIQALESSD